MAIERRICCCGAEKWTRVIAWFQIVGNVLFLIFNTIAIIAFANINTIDEGMPVIAPEYTNAAIATIAISLVISLLGLIMGIILLKGTYQKRVGYLRAWLIYGIAAIISSVVITSPNIYYGAEGSSIPSVVITGLLGIAINAFTLCVVYIHMKEINEGVFTQFPNQPPTRI